MCGVKERELCDCKTSGQTRQGKRRSGRVCAPTLVDISTKRHLPVSLFPLSFRARLVLLAAARCVQLAAICMRCTARLEL